MRELSETKRRSSGIINDRLVQEVIRTIIISKYVAVMLPEWMSNRSVIDHTSYFSKTLVINITHGIDILNSIMQLETSWNLSSTTSI